MSFLGDYFPKNLQEESSERKLAEVGTVIRMVVKFKNIEKPKRLIILGKNKDGHILATVVINSDINHNVHRTAIAKHMQYELPKEGREYLEKTSTVDCTKLYTIPLKTAQKTILEKKDWHLGTVSKEDLEEIILRVKSSFDITKEELKEFGLPD